MIAARTMRGRSTAAIAGWLVAAAVAAYAAFALHVQAFDAEQASHQQQQRQAQDDGRIAEFQQCIPQPYGQDDIGLLQHNGDLLVVRVQAQCVAKPAGADQAGRDGDPQRTEPSADQRRQQQPDQRSNGEGNQRKHDQAPESTTASMNRAGGAA